MSIDIQALPPLTFVELVIDADLAEAIVSIAERAVKQAQLLENEEACFGLEVSAAYRQIADGNQDSKLKALLARPAIEPWLALYKRAVLSPQITPFTMLSVGGSLAGRKVQFRRAPSFGRAYDGDVQFEWPFDAQRWFSDSIRILHQPETDTICAARIYARTVIGHPLNDANGRLARFLVHVVLARNYAHSCLPLALAPAFYAARVPLARGLVELSQSGDWRPYLSAFSQAIVTASELGQDSLGARARI